MGKKPFESPHKPSMLHIWWEYILSIVHFLRLHEVKWGTSGRLEFFLC